ncbi:unnamed protein product [Sympodiomycopsis kandeliae]
MSNTVTEKIHLAETQGHDTGPEQQDVSRGHSTQVDFAAGENPRTWSTLRKWQSVVLVSLYSIASTIASSMVAPALPYIAEELGIDSAVTQNMVLSIFLLAYAVGPLLLGPLGETFGRSIILHTTISFFLVFNLACSFATNSSQLLAFRFLSGIGASGSTAVGSATTVDLFPPQQRGKAMALYAFGPLLGPAIGPILGGVLIQTTNEWRWIFWSSCIYAALVFVLGLIFIRETYTPVLLARKSRKLRKQGLNVYSPFDDADDGEETTPSAGFSSGRSSFMRKLVTTGKKVRTSSTRPLRFLLTQPIIALLAFDMYTVYGGMYLLLTIVPSTFQDIYKQSPAIASLNYISVALGFTFGCQLGGWAVDRSFKLLTVKYEGQSRPEYKLPPLLVSAIMIPLGMALFGYTVEKRLHWIIPNISAFILATGNIGSYISIQAYLVDLMPLYSSSCIAAAVFMRSLGGFTFPLFGAPLYAEVGYTKASAALAGVLACGGVPIPVLLWFWGPRLRQKPERFMEKQKGGRFLQ